MTSGQYNSTTGHSVMHYYVLYYFSVQRTMQTMLTKLVADLQFNNC